MSSNNIYSTSNSKTKYDNFKPTRLYIKKHTITGLLYFGKSVRDDVYRYLGSGLFWKNHIDVHGRHHVKTMWVSDWFLDPKDIEEFALFFSEEHDIVNSDVWANLIQEDGLTSMKQTAEMRQRAKENTKKTKSDPEWKATVGVDQIRKMRETRNTTEWKDTVGDIANKKHRDTMNDPIWRETVEVERSRKHKEVKSDQYWKETVGKEQHRKQLETKSDPEWKATIGAEANRKQKETMNDPEWRKNHSEKTKMIRNNPEWKETTGKEAARKISEIRLDPEWQATVGVEALRKRNITTSTIEWKENNSRQCDHCNKIIDKANYIKWHGDRCKHNKNRNNDDIVSCSYCGKIMNKTRIKKHESICIQ